MQMVKVLALGLLYFIQGVPFGFQTSALPVLLRRQSISLTRIGFLQILGMPWLFKFLWAPLVDRYPSRLRNGNEGKRKLVWILPLQLLTVLALLAARHISGEAFEKIDRQINLFALIFFLVNFFTSTMDIAVDGLAIDTLESHELGWGNAAQVVGFKAGMLFGGGFIIWISEENLRKCLFAMSIAIFIASIGAIALLGIVFGKHNLPKGTNNSVEGAAESKSQVQSLDLDMKTIVKRIVLTIWRHSSQRWLVLAVMTYKTGEIIGDRMFKLFLVDIHFDLKKLSLVTSVVGMGFSLVGSLFGGYLSSKMFPVEAVQKLAFVSAFAQFYRFVSVYSPLLQNWIGVSSVLAIESSVGGALTTCMFAAMMEQVDPEIGATHYTILAALEVFGKSVPGLFSGYLTDAYGYTLIFAANALFSALFCLISLQLVPQRKPIFRVPEEFIPEKSD